MSGNGTRIAARWPERTGARRDRSGRPARGPRGARRTGSSSRNWARSPSASRRRSTASASSAVDVGNPHAVVDGDPDDLPRIGPLLEVHPRFPKRTNVQVARRLGDGEIEARVWERGAGETASSGHERGRGRGRVRLSARRRSLFRAARSGAVRGTPSVPVRAGTKNQVIEKPWVVLLRLSAWQSPSCCSAQPWARTRRRRRAKCRSSRQHAAERSVHSDGYPRWGRCRLGLECLGSRLRRQRTEAATRNLALERTELGPVGSKAISGNLTPLFAVAATAGDAWAVGGRSDDRTIVLHWRRGTWAVVPVPPGFRKTGLSSVAVVSPHDVWAIGTNNMLHWNGKGWSRQAGPNFHGGTYGAVAHVPGTAQVWVTGLEGGGGLTAARWSGSNWELAPLPPRLGGSGAIGAVSASSAWLATASSTGALRQRSGFLRWDGSSWTTFPAPNPAPFDEIRGVAVRSATDAWAVGEYSPHAGRPYVDSRSWVLHWNGTAWSRLQAPAGAGLNAVAVVPGTRDAWAVGGSIAVRYHC